MREINTSIITHAVAGICQNACLELGDNAIVALKKARRDEESELGKEVLDQILENARIAKEERLPLCQDCGTAVVFLEVGQDVHIVGGDLYTAVSEGVRQGYTQGYLRKSMVSHPFSSRDNSGDNTPPVIHTEIVPGDRLNIVVMPKGAGSENVSRLAMLTPGAGKKAIIDFVVKTVDEAGASPCPPVIVGVGIGGTAEQAMLLAKKVLLRPVGQPSPDPEVADLEKDTLERVNALGIGPSGLGGRITALAVHAEARPTHIASLPVAVTFLCHSMRHKEISL